MKYKYVDDYIMIQNLMPIELCKSLIRENSLPEKKWSKHSWYNYRQDDSHSMKEKELDVPSLGEIKSALSRLKTINEK